jgi:hypothetical protein
MLEAGLRPLFTQRPDLLEPGASAAVCPEARHSGGWGFRPEARFWMLGLVCQVAQRPDAGGWGFGRCLPMLGHQGAGRAGSWGLYSRAKGLRITSTFPMPHRRAANHG